MRISDGSSDVCSADLCDVCGVFWGGYAGRDPEGNAAHIRTLYRLWQEGKIAPKVSRTWPLEQGGDAIAHMAARKSSEERRVGKSVSVRVELGGRRSIKKNLINKQQRAEITGDR